jgi:hypothetical protein
LSTGEIEGKRLDACFDLLKMLPAALFLEIVAGHIWASHQLRNCQCRGC